MRRANYSEHTAMIVNRSRREDRSSPSLRLLRTHRINPGSGRGDNAEACRGPPAPAGRSPGKGRSRHHHCSRLAIPPPLLLVILTLLVLGCCPCSLADESSVMTKTPPPPDDGGDGHRHHHHPPEDVVVSVSLWDDDDGAGAQNDWRRGGDEHEDDDEGSTGGSPQQQRPPRMPRYVIGKLVAVVDDVSHDEGGADHDDGGAAKTSGSGALKSSNKLRMKGHYFTFDLGNSKQSIFVAEGCRGCDCPPNTAAAAVAGHFDHSNDSSIGMSWSLLSSSPVSSHHTDGRTGRTSPPAVDCCPNTVPCECGNGTDTDIGTVNNGDFCWPSHRENYLPRDSYRDAKGADCPMNVSKTTGVVDGRNSTMCMQCFGCRSHSRFYTMAESDSLALVLDDDVSITDDDEDDASSILTLGDSFKFGALVRTTPNLDRVWSNVGLGYDSSFLTQMNVSSFLLHLRPRPGEGDGDGGGGWDERSHIVLNPSPGRYLHRRGVRVVPFELDERNRRIHQVEMLVIGGGGGKGGGGGGMQVRGGSSDDDDVGGGGDGRTTTPFHMDTGNDGVSLADGTMIRGLAAATGGEWRRAGKEKEEEGRFGLLDEYDESEDEPRGSIGGGGGGGGCNVTTTRRLFVPYGPSDAPTLDVVLYPNDVSVSLPGSGWVTSNGGRTIFSTYHKNVLGLPFLVHAGVDVVFDDVNRLLYVVKDDDDVVNASSGLTASIR